MVTENLNVLAESTKAIIIGGIQSEMDKTFTG